MTTTTLAIVNATTLMDGLVELLRIGDALQAAQPLDCGVTLWRDPDQRLNQAIVEPELPAGVLQDITLGVGHFLVDPWAEDGHPTGLPHVDHDSAARRELLELLAHVTHGDILATAEGVSLLQPRPWDAHPDIVAVGCVPLETRTEALRQS